MLFLDPVLASDGVVYERAAIERWIALAAARGRRPSSPVTRAPLRRRALAPVAPLRRLAAAVAESPDTDAILRREYAERYLRRAVQRREASEILRAKRVWGPLCGPFAARRVFRQNRGDAAAGYFSDEPRRKPAAATWTFRGDERS